MTESAEDFRAEIASAYDSVLNTKGDKLRLAAGGVGALADWMRDDLFVELNRALECANPGDVDWACARIGLAALMMRDASRAVEKIFDDAYAGPEEGRDERIAAGLSVHARRPTGAQMIAQERFRQIDEEKWTAEHDDRQNDDPAPLISAAICYAAGADLQNPLGPPPTRWPWDIIFWKPGTPIRMLVKAGALIAAEIDRRLRAGEKP